MFHEHHLRAGSVKYPATISIKMKTSVYLSVLCRPDGMFLNIIKKMWPTCQPLWCVDTMSSELL